jgi:hypothetical protein
MSVGNVKRFATTYPISNNSKNEHWWLFVQFLGIYSLEKNTQSTVWVNWASFNKLLYAF